MLENYINQLCIALDITEDVSTDDPNVYALQLDEDIFVTITELDPGFTLVAPLSPIREMQREELFVDLMSANLFGQGTGGAVIGLDREGKELSISEVIAYDTDYQEFEELLEGFANQVEEWQVEIQRRVG